MKKRQKCLVCHIQKKAILAEFYSQNLATEVKKGMGEKIKSGGTVGRAPIGYQNVRYVDEKGREERTVITDPERAPLIKLAFEQYSTGEWTVADLADHLAACGLNTRATPKIPSQPVNLKTLHKVLVNPYYKGIVKYKGIEYQGSHEALISEETWDKVQSILASRLNGERSLRHPHFLKGSVYCAYCGERMLVTNVTKKNGTVYPYFYCAGRHSGRRKDCKTHSVLISIVEKEIEKIYDSYQLPSNVREILESRIQEVIAKEKDKYDKELDGLKGQKAQLENKRKKLLEAHYSDAIPLDLLKSEQQKIAKELTAIEHELKMHNMTFEQIRNNLKLTLDIVENCGDAYRNASDTIKRLMNQAIFEKFYIISNDEVELDIEFSFRPPFDKLLEPIKDDIAQINKNKSSNRIGNALTIAKGHIQEFLECGLSDVDNPSNMSTYSNDGYFFRHKSLSKVLLVEMRGVEPLSENHLPGLSTSVSGVFVVPHAQRPSAGFVHRQPLSHDRAKGVPRFTFTANLRLYPGRGAPGKDGSLLVRLQPPSYKNFGCKKLFCRLFLNVRVLKRSAPLLAYQGLQSPSKPLHPLIYR